MRCPCKDCQRRTLTCHGVCKEYQQWKQEREQANARREAENEKTDYVIAAMTRRRGKRR